MQAALKVLLEADGGSPGNVGHLQGAGIARAGDSEPLASAPQTERDDRILLRSEEAAKVLGVSRAQVFVLARRGGLPCVRIGRSVRFPRKALQAWVEEKTQEPSAKWMGGRRPFTNRHATARRQATWPGRAARQRWQG
ncbi:MAG TPA: helix-turn-helix domain-containing protein [Armatimonadetes bacterium]|nr:helix-turn-helix domain-containing protein [Armatimonadota bacterium]